MATETLIPDPPLLSILPAEDSQPQQPQPAADSPPAKRKRRRGKKRGRKKGSRNRQPSVSPFPLVGESATTTTTTTESIPSSSSEPAAPAERLAEFDRAVAAVPAQIGEPTSAPVVETLPGATPEPDGELEQLGPDFRAIAEEYLPKAFDTIAAFLGPHWELRAVEKKILVPECAGCLEELYPEWQKFFGSLNLRYLRTVEFGVALAIPLLVRIHHQRKIWKEKKAAERSKQPDPLAPASTAPATGMPGSAGLSGSSGSRDAENPFAWVRSSTRAAG